MKTQTLTLSWPWYAAGHTDPVYQVESSSNPIAYKPGQRLTEQEVKAIQGKSTWAIKAIRSK